MDKLYIPGDLVMVKKSALQFAKDKIFKVISSLSGGFLNVVMLNDSSTTYSISNNDIRPIPLTPEILEKNMWYGVTHSKQSDDNTKILYKNFKRKGYPTIKVSQDLKNTCELSPFIVKLESVSDLQHLLFGLGLNSEMEV